MDRVEDLAENILSIAIYDLIPSLSGHKIKNKLLDGTMHIQTVGDPLSLVSFTIVADGYNMKLINQMDFIGQDIKVFYDNKFYVGLIDSLSNWQEQMFGEVDTRLYSATITIVVSGDGTI